ncbi:MAG: alpha/beta fold hydrolase [Gammaproteobacteria bacterium]|nr:alpha/beta fold hydrolase [Gammaproteobacteria bacterium]MBU1558789.1 alpha/beta fold hydrolase [Gammaproteobacteria bacterium]MBU1628778.1 alpha/beta fold hydrolase [Gammaproteobacteria bacterium]MBU1927099.1 alpha/beta fold hydrolase [Gammaproteobacteria bacterium]
MSTFVLVHGAYQGGWVWDRVRVLLEKKGHLVYTPTLTGMSGTSEANYDEVHLSDYIDDICGLIEDEDLHDVVLVGHSYAGMILSGALSRISDRLLMLVYLDAVIPEDRKSFIDMAGEDRRQDYQNRTVVSNYGGKYIAVPSPQRLGLELEEDIDLFMPRYRSQPLQPFYDKVSIDQQAFDRIPKVFINCKKKTVDDSKRLQLVERLGMQYREIETGHSCMVTKPEELAEILIACEESILPFKGGEEGRKIRSMSIKMDF